MTSDFPRDPRASRGAVVSIAAALAGIVGMYIAVGSAGKIESSANRAAARDAAVSLGAKELGVEDEGEDEGGDAAEKKDAADDAAPGGAPDPAMLCAPIRMANQKSLAFLRARSRSCHTPTPATVALLDTCQGSANGAWTVALSKPTFQDEADPATAVRIDKCTAVQMNGTFVYLGNDGSIARSKPSEVWQMYAPGMELTLTSIRAVDYAEGGPALLVRDESSGEGTFVSETLYGVKDGVVERYPALRGITVDHFEDVDRDGFPDALSRGPYTSIESGRGLAGLPAVDAIFVYHAVQGRFVLDDVSGKHLEAICRNVQWPPRPLADAGEANADSDSSYQILHVSLSIACARARGLSAETIRAALEPHCADYCAEFPPDCSPRVCPAWLEAMVKPAPLISLPPLPSPPASAPSPSSPSSP